VPKQVLGRLVVLADLSSEKTASLICNLWKLALKAGMASSKKEVFLRLVQDLADRETPVEGAAELLVKIG
jgi:hypothetical protein